MAIRLDVSLGLLVMGGIVFLFAMVMGAGVILARRRSTRQDALLSVLAIATERGRCRWRPRSPASPISTAADIVPPNHGIWPPDDQRGASLPEALEQSRNLVSRDAVLLAWVGRRPAGCPALRLAATTRSNQLPIWTAITARLSYIVALLLAMQTIVSFILYFIMPKFEAIFRDFDMSLPRITIAVIDASHFIVSILLPHDVDSDPRALASGAFCRSRFSSGTIIRYRCSIACWAGGIPRWSSFPGSLSSTAASRSRCASRSWRGIIPTGWVRRRLLMVDKDVEQGADWIDSLRDHRVIRPADADVLASAAAVGNLAWALFELADSADRRLATRIQMVVQTLFPLVVVLLGIAVFFMAMAYFVPLVCADHGVDRPMRPRPTRKRRRGSLLVELAMAIVLLMIVMSLTVKVLGFVAIERRATRAPAAGRARSRERDGARSRPMPSTR